MYTSSVLSSSEKEWSNWKDTLSSTLVMPSTLSLHACTLTVGLRHVTQSWSRLAASLLDSGRLRTHMQILLPPCPAVCRRSTSPESSRHARIILTKSTSPKFPASRFLLSSTCRSALRCSARRRRSSRSRCMRWISDRQDPPPAPLAAAPPPPPPAFFALGRMLCAGYKWRRLMLCC
jgi:hypothetical protein